MINAQEAKNLKDSNDDSFNVFVKQVTEKIIKAARHNNSTNILISSAKHSERDVIKLTDDLVKSGFTINVRPTLGGWSMNIIWRYLDTCIITTERTR